MDTGLQEQDLKKLIKQLFIEKKRVLELEKKLKEQPASRLLIDQQKNLQQTLAEKERTIAQLQKQLSKARPALKQLFDQLQEAKEQLARQDLPAAHSKELEEKLNALKNEHEKIREQERKEAQRFESEKVRLVEKLAESLSQHQRHHETVKDLHEEINRLRQSNIEIKGHVEKGQSDLEALMEQKQQDVLQLKAYQEREQKWISQEEALRNKLSLLENRLSESDMAAVHEEYAEKLKVQKEVMQKLEESLAETQQEVRQAQHHLAKKVKETTLLRDLTEEQKANIETLQANLGKLQAELQQLKHSSQLQKVHEEKLQLLIEEWQDKFRDQSTELTHVKEELAALQKIKRQHDEMATKLAELKALLGKSNE